MKHGQLVSTQFKPGVAWNGNKLGRPKKNFSRDSFTDELFEESKDDLRDIKNLLMKCAKAGEPWAIKLAFEYFLTKATAASTPEELESKHLLIEAVKVMSDDRLLQGYETIKSMIGSD